MPAEDEAEDDLFPLDPDAIDAESEGDRSLRLFMYRDALMRRTREVARLRSRLRRVLTWADVPAWRRDARGEHGRVWSKRSGER
jgi:hypothetical protein